MSEAVGNEEAGEDGSVDLIWIERVDLAAEEDGGGPGVFVVVGGGMEDVLTGEIVEIAGRDLNVVVEVIEVVTQIDTELGGAAIQVADTPVGRIVDDDTAVPVNVGALNAGLIAGAVGAKGNGLIGGAFASEVELLIPRIAAFEEDRGTGLEDKNVDVGEGTPSGGFAQTVVAIVAGRRADVIDSLSDGAGSENSVVDGAVIAIDGGEKIFADVSGSGGGIELNGDTGPLVGKENKIFFGRLVGGMKFLDIYIASTRDDEADLDAVGGALRFHAVEVNGERVDGITANDDRGLFEIELISGAPEVLIAVGAGS